MAQPNTVSVPPADLKIFKIIVHLGFALTGVVTTLTGAILPVLSRRWNLDDAQAGYLLAAQNIGGLLSTLFVGVLIKRLGMKWAQVLSLVLMTLGLAGIQAGVFSLGLAAIFLSGLGLGIAIPATNILIAEINPERRAAALNVLNFIWCTGAVIGTPLIGLVVQKINLFTPLAGLILALLFIALRLSREDFHKAALSPSTDKQASNDATALQNRFALYVCAFAFLLVGIENALSGWIASYVTRLESAQSSYATFYQAAFWAAMLTGRATAPRLLRRFTETHLIAVGISVAACGIMLILASLNLGLIITGVLVTGLGLAPVFPTTIAIFSQILGTQTARKSSWLFASGSLGSSALPFLVGFVSSRFHSLRIGLSLPLIAALAAIVIQVNLNLLMKRLKAGSK
jgi:fucose permease